MGSPLAPGFSLTDLDGAPASSATTPVTALGQGDTFSQAQGTVRRYSVALLDPDSQQPLDGIFSGSEALRCYAWEGAEGPILASFAASWAVASPPLVYLDVTGSDLATLAVQPYPVRLEVDRGGQWQEAWDGWIEVLDEPATAPSPMAPGSYKDMLGKGGDSIKQLLTIDSGAGFLRERAEAWTYLRQVILARYRPIGGQRGGWGGLAGLPGYWTSIDYPNIWLAQQLDAGKLLVTDQVREILARKALAILFLRQSDPEWRRRGRVESLSADWLIASLVAGIDVNADGYPDVTINCGVINTRDI